MRERVGGEMVLSKQRLVAGDLRPIDVGAADAAHREQGVQPAAGAGGLGAHSNRDPGRRRRHPRDPVRHRVVLRVGRLALLFIVHHHSRCLCHRISSTVNLEKLIQFCTVIYKPDRENTK